MLVAMIYHTYWNTEIFIAIVKKVLILALRLLIFIFPEKLML